MWVSQERQDEIERSTNIRDQKSRKYNNLPFLLRWSVLYEYNNMISCRFILFHILYLQHKCNVQFIQKRLRKKDGYWDYLYLNRRNYNYNGWLHCKKGPVLCFMYFLLPWMDFNFKILLTPLLWHFKLEF